MVYKMSTKFLIVSIFLVISGFLAIYSFPDRKLMNMESATPLGTSKDAVLSFLTENQFQRIGIRIGNTWDTYFLPPKAAHLPKLLLQDYHLSSGTGNSIAFPTHFDELRDSCKLNDCEIIVAQKAVYFSLFSHLYTGYWVVGIDGHEVIKVESKGTYFMGNL